MTQLSPPPPSPPPVPRVSTRHHHHQHLSAASPVPLEKDLRFLLQPLIKGDRVTLTYLHNVPPQLQVGAPMCGIVALSMAAELLTTLSIDCASAGNLLDVATGHGLSKKGEILSAASMVSLANMVLPMLDARVLPISEVTPQLLLNYVMLQRALLVPYDSDKDHTPCLARGHKAHWCLIVGIAVTSDNDKISQKLLESCKKDIHVQNHYTLPSLASLAEEGSGISSEGSEISPHVGELVDNGDVYVFARHGKSRHLAMWSWSTLLESNANLAELDPNRMPEDYIVPSEGLGKALGSQVVIIQNKQT